MRKILLTSALIVTLAALMTGCTTNNYHGSIRHHHGDWCREKSPKGIYQGKSLSRHCYDGDMNRPAVEEKRLVYKRVVDQYPVH